MVRWFGFALHGWLAKATETLHWVIYAGAGILEDAVVDVAAGCGVAGPVRAPGLCDKGRSRMIRFAACVTARGGIRDNTPR